MVDLRSNLKGQTPKKRGKRAKRARHRAAPTVKRMKRVLAKKKKDAIKVVHNRHHYPWKLKKAALLVRYNNR